MGRDLASGLPRLLTITSSEVRGAIAGTISKVIGAVRDTLENTPPELAGDIYSRGIIMTGNGSLIKGLDELIHRSTGIDVTVADEPGLCVVRGAYKVLMNMNETQKNTI